MTENLTYPLLQSQMGIYIECMEHHGEVFYSIPYLYTLDRSIDIEQLKDAVVKAFCNHPFMFSRIIQDQNGTPQMVLHTPAPFDIPVKEVEDMQALKSSLPQPFDLTGDEPLFRVSIYFDSEHVYLFLDLHHAIVDGTGLSILISDMEHAYAGEPLEPEAVSAVDIALAEEEARKSPRYQEAQAWYQKEFSEADELSSVLLHDKEEHEKQTKIICVDLPNLKIQQVRDFCHEHHIKTSTFFTSAFGYLLARYNGEEQSLFSTIYHGREAEHMERTTGMFVKTYPVYSHFAYDDKVIDYLANSQQQMEGSRAHSIFSFGDVMNDLKLRPGILYAYQGNFRSEKTLCGSSMTVERLANVSDDDLSIMLYQKDEGYMAEMNYRADHYSEELLTSLMDAYAEVLKGMLTKQTLREVTLLSEKAEKKLDTFFGPHLDYDKSQTIVSLFRHSVAQYPDKLCVDYDGRSYTYREVDEISDKIAAHLVERLTAAGVDFSTPNSSDSPRAISVLINRSEWMLIASMGVLKTGCGYQPLDASYPPERLNFMMKDAQSLLLIADRELRDIVNEYEGEVLYIDEIASLPSKPSTLNLPEVHPEDLFILLYTSGSTGVPKGVMLTHSNLVAFTARHLHELGIDHTSHTAPYASYGFDVFMTDTYPPLTCGASIYIVPEEIRLDLNALNEFFEKNQITHTIMTTQVGCQFAMNIENHSLKYLIVAGEKILSFDPPKDYQLVNGYGPTETTITNTNYHVKEHLNNVPIGTAHDNMRMYIVDKLGQRAPIGCQGELWACGPQVGKGYLHLPEKTAEAFIQNPFDSTYPYDRAYRTGDTTCWRYDGNIFYMGRKDGQVKIRGFRIELKEVEGVIRKFKGIKDVTVQAFDADGGGKFIAAYIVADEQVNIEALNQFIMDEKPPYMVPAVTMQIEKIPLNVNQKVDKKALPKPELQAAPSSADVPAAPLNALEQQIKELISDIIKVEEYSITEPLVYLGLTSISCIRLATVIYKRYGVKLNTKQFAKTGTLQEIENVILEKWMNPTQPDGSLNSATPDGSLNSKLSTLNSQLTYPQQGVYYDIMKNPTGTTYNIPICLDFPEGTDAELLKTSVQKVLMAHPILFEHFEAQGDEMVQVIPEQLNPQIDFVKANGNELDVIKQTWAQPFDLDKGPLYHAKIVDDGQLHLLLDFLHLAADGASVNLMTSQLMQLMNGEEIEQESFSYIDYAMEEKAQESSAEFQQAKEFFDSRLKTMDGISTITEDVKANETAEKHLLYVSEQVDMPRIQQFASHLGITPAALFLAAANYTVSRYTNSADVAMCTISNGRSNVKFSDTVGMMVNTLAITSHIKDVTVQEFIAETANEFDATLSHENYPFAKVSAAFGITPDTFFQYQIGVMPHLSVGGKDVALFTFGDKTPKFKFTISIEPNPDRIEIQYDDTCYTQALAQGFATSMKSVLDHFIEAPQTRLRGVSMLNPAQKELIATFHETERADIPIHLYHRLFEKSVSEHAQDIALVALNPLTNIYAEYTFEQLNAQMNRLAHSLMRQGVQPRDRVAILLPRTSRLILSQYAILKTGAAYIPCDPKYPTERINLILEDSEARFIITTADRLGEFPGKALDVEALLRETTEADEVNPNADVSPDDLAYLIYTSGSTGRPKGVQLMHKGVCNYHCEKNIIQGCLKNECHAALGITTISFDMSVWETGSPLMLGKKLVFVGDEDCNDPMRLAMLIEQNGVDCMTATTSRFMQLLESSQFEEVFRTHIHLAYQGGEALSPALLKKLQGYPGIRIFNGYGPTETIANSHASELTQGDVAHIGKPCVNYTNFIVDNDGNELPIGVIGELVIGGASVAKGYNNLPEQTAEKFVPSLTPDGSLNSKLSTLNSKLYKTGDYARWLPDGNVMLLGRKDNQVKLRGLRIELGEVESAITQAGDVLGGKGCIKNVVVMIRKISGKDHLCAYFTASLPIAIDDLKQEISKTLTLYMVPSAYLQMEAFPLTPNGKTDVKHLPDPQLAQMGGDYVAPANEIEQHFCEIFAKILDLDKVGATDDFFEMGGSSLVVTRILIEADKLGYKMIYSDVFSHPTPRQLAQLMGAPAVEDTDEPELSNYDYTAIHELLKQNTIDAFQTGERNEYHAVLLTGATGYLGIHLLHELILSPVEKIYCLVRHNGLSADSRLRTMLFYYFDHTYEELFGSRIITISGDVTDDILPLDSHLKDVDLVINSAALVKHFSETTEIEDINVGGVQRCVDFCKQTGARLVQISTDSTGGMAVNGKQLKPYTETMLYQQQYIGNQYVVSKFKGERLILEAMAKGELHAKIMRVGNLSARDTDGEFQANINANSFMGRLRVFQMLGAYPIDLYDKRVEFSPIDQSARAIILLSQTPDACCVFHPFNNHVILLGDVVRQLKTIGYDVENVEQEEFDRIMKEAGNDPDKARRLVSFMAYQGKANGQKVAVDFDNTYTMRVLHRLGFYWSFTTFDYIQLFLKAIHGLGYFDM